MNYRFLGESKIRKQQGDRGTQTECVFVKEKNINGPKLEGNLEKYRNNVKWVVTYGSLGCDCEVIIAHNEYLKACKNMSFT